MKDWKVDGGGTVERRYETKKPMKKWFEKKRKAEMTLEKSRRMEERTGNRADKGENKDALSQFLDARLQETKTQSHPPYTLVSAAVLRKHLSASRRILILDASNEQTCNEPTIPRLRVSNTRLAQAASGCAPSVEVLPISNVAANKAECGNTAKMHGPSSLAGSYNKRLGTSRKWLRASVEVLPISDVAANKAECGNTAKMRAPTSLAGSYDTSVWGKESLPSAPHWMSLGSDSETKRISFLLTLSHTLLTPSQLHTGSLNTLQFPKKPPETGYVRTLACLPWKKLGECVLNSAFPGTTAFSG
ncbi:hypothetical protein WN51_03045 [Melipona quadrifasciata]|uniref:Uncharacterized protein n=1 Tax=Melipona quadrifasciata TaxID=166423 RepID=A0A0M8ZVD4_9HYME|nr:hypothetical protein WN51_03045 [Melipona quadrifasciata]